MTEPCICGHAEDEHAAGVAGCMAVVPTNPDRELVLRVLGIRLGTGVLMTAYADHLAAVAAGFKPPTGHGRCERCACHVATQGHRDGCPNEKGAR